MFSSVLIANRGEIAVRVIRTARRLGLRTIAVYSDADARALHVRMADEAHAIGASPAAQSYLSIETIVAVAKATGAECIHPGYGFLSENAAFAEACRDAGIVFVGPPPAAIRAMGLKDRAKALMEKAGVPVVPGYHGDKQDAAFLKRKAYEIGYPVLIKAVAGGGGKGMRKVERHAEFDAALEAAQREASGAFGDAQVLIEKYVTAPRHIELQVFADAHGNAIHLNERDCSLQRRHQKVIEEAPAPGMSADLRAKMGAAAVAAAKAVGYVGAGTVEFIADGAGGLKDDGFWFMEMNTRLQVEHPVTEAVTGLDLVEWQFRIAAGEKLPLKQDQVRLDGHAVEARLYAEDPERGFLPSTGRLVALSFPQCEGLRIDSGVEAGDTVTPFYDPMIAKVIAHGATRDAALDILAEALEQTVVAGPRSNAGFLAALARADGFRQSDFDTGFIERNMDALGAVPQGLDRAAAAAGARALVAHEQMRNAGDGGSPWDVADGFQLSGARRLALPVIADGEAVVAEVDYGADGVQVSVEGEAPASDAAVIAAPEAIYVLRNGRQTKVTLRDLALDQAGDAGSGGVVRAPMHGKVLAILVEPGAQVARGQRVAIIEAMKMEHTLTAPIDGTVGEIAVAKDAQVAEGARILVVAPADAGQA
ncbi:MAG TPA: acetyl-CoA carboxylase biotin carboxylase subunit [Pseudolabrys sp.]|uniref:acetyl/propionyl/methylcrotonyl-CoA carboxylase subunit alpha n=1 Tax=Pseudolabrys sp. TaxID=1960880 RepID=UPI002DDD0241|nr:acetyl-CoA carboxylase biotin carboxylase subunit [Pseudolabrys sp.]HEV2630615.1 acetyl-CoA carboxylase biotin carboxylase subunit [Pseudolabrys sp.]